MRKTQNGVTRAKTANCYIYIDDSGDPGLKATSSSNFVIAAVVVASSETRNELESAINNYQKGLGWSDQKELKFNKSGKDAIRLAIRAVQKCAYEAYAIVLNKQKVISGHVALPEQTPIFLYVIKELLYKLVLDGATVVIDGAYGPKYITKARTYLRQQLRDGGIQNITVHFVDSKKSPLIQLADLVAGSVAKSLSRTEKDQEFVRLFGKKLKRIYEL